MADENRVLEPKLASDFYDVPGVSSQCSVFFRTVGRNVRTARTDLVDPDRTEDLARAQYASLRRLATLPDDVAARAIVQREELERRRVQDQEDDGYFWTPPPRE